MPALLSDPDAGNASRAIQAMLKMKKKKIDIEALRSTTSQVRDRDYDIVAEPMRPPAGAFESMALRCSRSPVSTRRR